MDVAKARGAVRNRPRALVRDGLITLHPDVVVEVYGEGAQHVLHHDVAHADVFHHASSSAPGLEPDPPIGSDEDAVGDDDVADAAAHLAPYHHAAVTVHHRAVSYGDVLAGGEVLSAGRLNAGLNGDTVVAD